MAAAPDPAACRQCISAGSQAFGRKTDGGYQDGRHPQCRKKKITVGLMVREKRSPSRKMGLPSRRPAPAAPVVKARLRPTTKHRQQHLRAARPPSQVGGLPGTSGKDDVPFSRQGRKRAVCIAIFASFTSASQVIVAFGQAFAGDRAIGRIASIHRYALSPDTGRRTYL